MRPQCKLCTHINAHCTRCACEPDAAQMWVCMSDAIRHDLRWHGCKQERFRHSTEIGFQHVLLHAGPLVEVLVLRFGHSPRDFLHLESDDGPDHCNAVQPPCRRFALRGLSAAYTAPNSLVATASVRPTLGCNLLSGLLARSSLLLRKLGVGSGCGTLSLPESWLRTPSVETFLDEIGSIHPWPIPPCS